MVAEGVIWNPRLDSLVSRRWEDFYKRLKTFGIPAAIEAWSARATDPVVVKAALAPTSAGLFKHHVFKACTVVDDEMIDLILASAPAAVRIGQNPHLQPQHVSRVLQWAIDSFHLRNREERAERGRPSTATSVVRSLIEGGYEFNKRSIDGLLQSATRGARARTDAMALGLLCDARGLSPDDIRKVFTLTADHPGFRLRIARNQNLSEADLINILDWTADSGVWATIAARPEVATSEGLRFRLVESRSDAVLRELLRQVQPAEWTLLYRQILSTRPGQAARLLSSGGVPEDANLSVEEVAPLLQSADRRVREAAIFALKGLTRPVEAQKGPAHTR